MSADRHDPLWYKDAIIYQLHIKAFADANDDGIGDFAGLTAKLDYIRDLGVTAIWLLPFYPSPLRDDGYDISEYKDIHPAYGTMADFRRFVRAAHDRGLRVITELVINHTSDQHPWFQRARRAKPGSPYRDFYVWSDTDTKYAGTRIIFTDTETSNWTWDPVAGQYYWHRFFSHQPDLNFANPRVIRAVTDVMRFWFDAGVDGMRLDAVPYLCEREGTNNENLPETHGVLKILRAIVDEEYPGRVFLAEANQWPEDVRQYFADGDECQMAFHFPLMPRMFMAIADEDRYPIIDIMRQTPEIPPTCQWAIFLRNHDELTLEMVTPRERQMMYGIYASDPRARINIGIRRRLAPLMENDRRRIELMTALLMSMPGTPIVYYGDEIGMGDNIYLSDRDGVRTPMQWSIDRNGGFSRSDPARLYLPPIQDPIYGFQAVNVEAQQRSPSSLLNWLKKLISVRQAHKVFGRGSLRFLMPGNRKVLAYIRESDDEAVLCVANLSRSPQAVSLDLASLAGRVPIEMLGWSAFPTIGQDRYVLTLPGHAFFWFLLSPAATAQSGEPERPERLPELVTLVLGTSGSRLLDPRTQTVLARDVLPAAFPSQRWYGEKDATIASIRLRDAVPIDANQIEGALAIAEVTSGAGRRLYALPLAISPIGTTAVPGTLARAALARTRTGPEEGLLVDGFALEAYPLALLDDMRAARRRQGSNGVFVGTPTGALDALTLPEPLEVRRLDVEQSNTSIVIGEHVMLKIYRKLSEGPQPELEIARFLERVGYQNTPELYGAIEYVPVEGEPLAVAIAQRYILSQGDGWSATTTYLTRFLDQRAHEPDAETPADAHAVVAERAAILGRRLAELHRAFATPTDDPAFTPEPASPADLDRWRDDAIALATRTLDALERAIERIPEGLREDASAIVQRREEILARLRDLDADLTGVVKTRFHGDFHLGQVLVVPDDVYIVDFEGEPARPLPERRRKSSPLRDVAGMIRSIDYAAIASVYGLTEQRVEDIRRLEPYAREWQREITDAFLASYREAIAGCPSVPGDPQTFETLLDLFTLEKALYEMAYELANRPAWVRIPLAGVRRVLDALEHVHA